MQQEFGNTNRGVPTKMTIFLFFPPPSSSCYCMLQEHAVFGNDTVTIYIYAFYE